jgi:hypothetical protein
LEERSIKKTREMGVTAKPGKATECLICHVTGGAEQNPQFSESFVTSDGVQCESCHGPGAGYAEMKTMRELRKNRFEGNTVLADKLGFVNSNTLKCLSGCHQSEITVNGISYKRPIFTKFKFSRTYRKGWRR